MKKFAVILSLFVAGCVSLGGKMDQAKAKAAVEALEQQISKGDYALSKFYSEQMNLSENDAQRADKFKKLHDAEGDFVSMECTSAANGTDPNDRSCVNLVYTIKHTKLTTIENFTVVDEGGDDKISVHDIKTQ
jgi:hypothetical protein